MQFRDIVSNALKKLDREYDFYSFRRPAERRAIIAAALHRWECEVRMRTDNGAHSYTESDTVANHGRDK